MPVIVCSASIPSSALYEMVNTVFSSKDSTSSAAIVALSLFSKSKVIPSAPSADSTASENVRTS